MLTYRTPQSFDFRFGRSKNEEKGIWSEFAEEELENNMPDEEDEDADS